MKWYFVKNGTGKETVFTFNCGKGITGLFNTTDFRTNLTDAIGIRNTARDCFPPKKWGEFEIWAVDLEKNKITKVKL